MPKTLVKTNIFEAISKQDILLHHPFESFAPVIDFIYRAATDPEVLLLDEITSALDPELVAGVLDLVRSLAGDGMTIVMATHEMGFARDVADRVAFLDDGRILESGTPAEVFGSPREERTRAFLARFTS